MSSSETVEEVADALEEHGSSRANFRDVSDNERRLIARQLILGRSQANASNADWDDMSFRSRMLETRVAYAYECGQAGMSPRESRYVWWNFVHDDPPPVSRDELI